ncbi:hypothetical protein [Dankookia sp. P2]|uniref:hypothetical protein n=1 Tax=Dankookia sp. P2 TaxID=3423955 RepID=UPI003D6727F0
MRGEEHVVLKEVGHRRPQQPQQVPLGAPHVPGDAKVAPGEMQPASREDAPEDVDARLDLGRIGYGPVAVPAEMPVLEKVDTLTGHAAILRGKAGEHFGKEFRAVER